MDERRKHTIRIVLNIILAGMVTYAMFLMCFRAGNGKLSTVGLKNLKYFTVLSNLLSGFAALLWIFSAKASDKTRQMAETVKYAAAVAVSLTFLTVLCMLGPLYGFGTMYVGANFWFHLVIPLYSVAEFIIFSEGKFGRKENFLSLIPLFIYGSFYLANILINGKEGNDIYGFVRWGLPVGFVILAVLTAVSYLTAFVLRKVRKK